MSQKEIEEQQRKILFARFQEGTLLPDMNAVYIKEKTAKPAESAESAVKAEPVEKVEPEAKAEPAVKAEMAAKAEPAESAATVEPVASEELAEQGPQEAAELPLVS